MRQYLKKFINATIIVLVIFTSMANSEDVYAGNITDIAEVVNSNTEISGDYSFFVRWIDGVTSVSTFGSGWVKYPYGYGGVTDVWGIAPSDVQKEKIGLIYHNVGRHKGKVIDLKITILDWKNSTGKNGGIYYGANDIAHSQQAYYFVKQKWEFIDSTTGNPVQLNAYMNITDIDANQGMRFDNATTNKIDKIYVQQGSEISYSKNNGELKIYDSELALAEPSDTRYHFTFLISNTSNVTFYWDCDWDSRGIPEVPSESQPLNGEFFSFSGKKLAPSSPTKPEKFINASGNTSNLDDLRTTSTFNSLSDTVLYELFHEVHDEAQEYYFNSYIIEDTLPKGLLLEGYNIYNDENKNVSSLFDVKTTNNKLTLTAKSTSLKSASFYNTQYRIEIKAKLDSEAVLRTLINGDRVTLVNSVDAIVNGTKKTSDRTTSTLYLRKVTVNHIDERTNKKIVDSTVDTYFDGEEYSYSPRQDLTKNGQKYTPTSNKVQSGVINGKDIELNFYYKAPLMTAGVKKLQIYTAKSTVGLPVKLNITKILNYELDEVDDFKESTITVSLYKEKSKIKSQTYTLDSLPSNISWVVPSSALSVDEKANYTIKLENYDSSYIVVNASNINTDGYSSSEKEITVDETEDLDYAGVVMTERSYNEAMKVHYETLKIPSSVLIKQKTGYGFNLDTEVYYTNDLTGFTPFNVKATVDSKIIDSYIDDEYKSNNGYTDIDMELVSSDISLSKKEHSFSYKLPNVNVEQKTGYLFTDNQVTNKYSKITNQVLKGDRKLYTPIWAELGDYSIDIASTSPIGINLVNFKINKNLNLYAFMYGHINSPTIDIDEILIEPVDTGNPFPNGKPKDWTESDVNWLKNN